MIDNDSLWNPRLGFAFQGHLGELSTANNSGREDGPF